MRTLLSVIAALLVTVVLVELGHDLDQRIADLAFNPTTASWLVNHQPGFLRTALYDGPKAILVLFGLLLLAGILFPGLPGLRTLPGYALRFLFLCMVLVPATTGAIKSASGISCPYAISRYGGDMPDRNSVFSVAGFTDAQRTDGCWPSGHVSGAFALLGLVLLPVPRRRLLTALILIPGFSMGAYQVLRGAHYASHIVISLCIAIAVIAILQRWLLHPREAPVAVQEGRHRLYSRFQRWYGRGRRLAQNSMRMPVAGSSGNQ